MDNRTRWFKIIFILISVISFLLLVFLCFIAGFQFHAYSTKAGSYWKKQYESLPRNIKRQVDIVIKNGQLTEADHYIIPNALWYHQLNPKHKENELNSMGFRNEEYTKQELNTRPLIICVGDSTTQNWVKPMKDGFPFLLGKKLEQVMPEAPPIVLNAGVGSMASNLVANLTINKIIHFNPEIVIIKVGYNDLIPLCTQKLTTYDYTQTYDHPFYKLVFNEKIIKQAKSSYEGKVRLAAHIKLNSETAFGPSRFYKTGYHVDLNKDKFFLYEQHVLATIGALRENNITPVLLDLPFPKDGTEDTNFYRGVSKGLFGAFCERMNGILEKIANEHNVLLVKVQPVLKHNDFWDHCHMMKSGNQKTADSLTPHILTILKSEEH